ncbi:MAG: hypothetical protein HC919_02560 [Oscillatoriales cyanobacterium SM2_2_1]|nr:hypothetical protein [Oscillatoriales cyanobacterium SM2_2_1]
MSRGMIPPGDRALGCLPFLLPLSASVVYGASFFAQVPVLAVPFLPFFWLYGNILSFPVVPFLGISGEFVIFAGLYLLVVRGAGLPLFVRFNAMQAILIQIALFIGQIITEVVATALGSPLLLQTLSNTLFMGVFTVCGLAIYECCVGRFAEIPSISQAAMTQCER